VHQRHVGEGREEIIFLFISPLLGFPPHDRCSGPFHGGKHSNGEDTGRPCGGFSADGSVSPDVRDGSRDGGQSAMFAATTLPWHLLVVVAAAREGAGKQ
jgi:hypothetical protein